MCTGDAPCIGTRCHIEQSVRLEWIRDANHNGDEAIPRTTGRSSISSIQ